MNFLLSDLTVVIPTKNDHYRIEENLQKLLDYLKFNIQNFEILIVSNGSSLLSVEYIDNLILGLENIKHLKINQSGKGLAIKTGLVESGFSSILYCDADLSVDISEFTNFINEGSLLSGFVVGNRKNTASENLASPLLRKLSGFFYLSLIKNLFGLVYEDTQCGFKAIDKKLFTKCIDFETEGFSFDLELFLLAQEEKIKITEIPVRYVHNPNSKVKIFKHTLIMLKEVYKIYKKYSHYEKT